MSNKKALLYGWPFPSMKKPNILFKLRSSAVVPMVGTFSKILLGWFNKVEAHNKETLRKYVRYRNKKPLITVSNHYSCLDDPGLWVLLQWKDVWNANVMRWSLAAHDICFISPIHNWFFSSGKCVPVIRGNGVFQQGMDFCIDRLKEGHWVHIFPEGKVNMTMENIRYKWGVGRLVYECPESPVVLPFHHIGMDTVLPNRPPYIPYTNKKVTILVGEPIDFAPIISRLKMEKHDDVTARKKITDIIQEEMCKLRLATEELHRQRFL